VALIVAANFRRNFVAISGAMAPQRRRFRWPSADALLPTSAKAWWNARAEMTGSMWGFARD
jgi:hypothetical protein